MRFDGLRTNLVHSRDIPRDRFPRSAMLLRPLTLHAGLSSEDQLSVFEPAPARTRKVIISTNLAEASVTIEGKNCPQ